MWFIWFIAAVLWAAPASAAYNDPVACAQLPALTGDTTKPIASCVTTDNLHSIGTQTVSAGASIAWTALGSTYSNYLIKCHALSPATSGSFINIQVGEGGTPTWNTTNYKFSGFYVGSDSATIFPEVSASAAGVKTSGSLANTETMSLTVLIHSVPSTTVIKHIDIFANKYVSSVIYTERHAGAYTNTTNAVTAFRLIASAGNINGVCTAWGFVQ